MTVDWWTLGLQTINVVILIWALSRFFWKPVAAIIEQRRVTARKMLDEAESMKAKQETQLADIEQIRAGFRQERDTILSVARQEAEQLREAMLQQATQEVAEKTDAGMATLRKLEQDQEAAWSERATSLAIMIAGKLLGRLHGPGADTLFLDPLVAAIQALPEPTLRAVAADHVELNAVSGSELSADAQTLCRDRIHASLGAAPRIVFRTDPDLIAGLELRGDHLLIDNSWRADLRRIEAELSHAVRS